MTVSVCVPGYTVAHWHSMVRTRIRITVCVRIRVRATFQG